MIVIGSPKKSRTERNPLNLKERKKLLNECFPELEKIPVQDEDRGKQGYPDWSKRLVEKTGADIVISNNELVEKIIEKYTGAEVREHELVEPDRFSGTRIREKIRNNKEWKNLVPECSRDKTTELEKTIRKSVK